MSRKYILIALGAVVLIGLCVGAWFVLSPSEPQPAAAAGNSGYEIMPTDHTMGNPKAKVVLIEYAAPICPHCAHFNADTFPQLKKNYIDTGKVFYVFRVYLLYPADGVAEKLALCLPKEKYFDFMDLLFRNQPKWDPEYASENPALANPEGVHAGLVQMARLAGMSAERADQCIASTAEEDRINKVGVDGQFRYNITGTPTFVLDGNPVGQGTVPTYADMQKWLDEALAAKQ